MLMDNDPAHHIHLHLVHLLPLHRAPRREIPRSIQHHQRSIRTALDDTRSILIHLQHTRKQHHRSWKRRQGNVAREANHETLIRNRHQHSSALLHIPEGSHQHLHRHSRTHSCHNPVPDRNVQRLPPHCRRHDPLQRRIRYRQHQDSLPPRTCSPGYLHPLLHSHSRNSQSRRSNLLERRTRLRRRPPGPLLHLPPQRPLEKPQSLVSQRTGNNKKKRCYKNSEFLVAPLSIFIHLLEK